MIEVEIRGPVAKKEYEKLKNILSAAGGNIFAEPALLGEKLYARYGGADFTLVDPGEDLFYYEARMTAKTPAEAEDAKQKLEKLARNFKLPMWTPIAMLEFTRRLYENQN